MLIGYLNKYDSFLQSYLFSNLRSISFHPSISYQCCAARWPRRACSWCPGLPNRSTNSRYIYIIILLCLHYHVPSLHRTVVNILLCNTLDIWLVLTIVHILPYVHSTFLHRWIMRMAPVLPIRTRRTRSRCCSGRTEKTKRKPSSPPSREYTEHSLFYHSIIYLLYCW